MMTITVHDPTDEWRGGEIKVAELVGQGWSADALAKIAMAISEDSDGRTVWVYDQANITVLTARRDAWKQGYHDHDAVL